MLNMENHVTSLELSKKLRELGVEQESYFWWGFNDDKNWCLDNKEHCVDENNKRYIEYYSAFLSSELGELLPPQLVSGIKEPWLVCTKNKAKQWEVGYSRPEGFIDGHMVAGTEADVRAKMLIYLIENKRIKL